MTGNRAGAGHSVSIPIALRSHRKAIDQDMCSLFCLFWVWFLLKNSVLFVLIILLEIIIQSPLNLIKKIWTKHTLLWQTVRQWEISINELLAASAHDLSTLWVWRARCDKVLPFWGQTRGFPGLRWEQDSMNLDWLLSVKQQDTWIFALSCSCQRGKPQGNWQKVSLSGVSTKLLGYHQ